MLFYLIWSPGSFCHRSLRMLVLIDRIVNFELILLLVLMANLVVSPGVFYEDKIPNFNWSGKFSFILSQNQSSTIFIKSIFNLFLYRCLFRRCMASMLSKSTTPVCWISWRNILRLKGTKSRMSSETYESGLELSKASQSHRRISSSSKFIRHALPKTLNNVRFTMRISVSHQLIGGLNFHSILSRLLNSLSSFQFKDYNAFWHPVKLVWWSV